MAAKKRKPGKTVTAKVFYVSDGYVAALAARGRRLTEVDHGMAEVIQELDSWRALRLQGVNFSEGTDLIDRLLPKLCALRETPVEAPKRPKWRKRH